MIDAIKVKDFLDVANTSSPPIEIVGAQIVPSIVGHAPILPPFFGERIDFENLFGRRATAPVQIKYLRIGPNVAARPANSVGDIAHEIDLLRFGIGFEILPL